MNTDYIPFGKDNASAKPGETHAALMIAHPGHELCLLGWLKKVRPCVFILTDGSGSGDQSRLQSTSELLSRLSVPAGEIYGRLSDAEVYRAIISGNAGIFCDLAAELSEIFTCRRFDYVVCEAVEGYNPTHDLCWFIIEAALARANRMSDHQTLGYEVNLIRRTSLYEEAPRENSIWLRLDDHALGEKMRTMRANPHLKDEVSAGLDGMEVAALLKYPELTAELQRLVNGMGPEAFRVEHLQPMKAATITDVPFYERYGETLVRSGRYAQAIRYSAHIAPIVEALRRVAESGLTARAF